MKKGTGAGHARINHTQPEYICRQLMPQGCCEVLGEFRSHLICTIMGLRLIELACSPIITLSAGDTRGLKRLIGNRPRSFVS